MPQPPSLDLTLLEGSIGGTGGTGWYKNTSIAETTQNQGGQGGTGVQGIALGLEKNKISVLSEPSLEKSLTVALTDVLEGGQDESRVDSCVLIQGKVDYADYPHLTSDTLEAKRNQAENIKERLLKAQTKEDLVLIREEYSGRCDWVWKNLLTKAQRRTLKEMAAIEQLNLLAAPQAISTPETQCWAEVEEAIATDPASLAEAWAQLTPKTVKAVIYSQGDKVAKKANPEQVGTVERFDADFGEHLVHFDFSSEWLNSADLIPVEVNA
jgi:hypothetical protein